MNLREKLGQRFIYRLPGVTQLTTEVAEFLVDCRAGGVVLFGYNVQTPEQVAKLNRDLQALAARKGLPPFIISIDEEGGQVSRMPARGQDLITPSQMALTIAGPEAVRACADVTARRLRWLGFNLNYAPVMDTNNNPSNPVIGTRSYGETPQKVAEMGAIAIKAYLKAGISPCVKHFPGHGDTDVDSHLGLPVVAKNLEDLHEFELIPFQQAIAAGVPAIMTAHILYPQIEKNGLPATFSSVLLTQLLRQQMGFDGLIVTDALDMRAIADRYPLGKASIMALQTGADVIMSFSMTLEEQRAAFEEVVAAAESGEIDISSNAQALARLESWRTRFCLPPAEFEPSQADYATVAQAARQGITVVNSNPDFLPLTKLSSKRPLLIDFTAGIESPVEEGRLPGPLLEQELRRSLPTLLRLEVAARPTEADIQRVLSWASQSDLLLVVTRNAKRYASQAKLVRELLTRQFNQAPTVVMAAREPYDLQLFPEAALTVATYGDPPATIKALANLLTGNSK